MGFVSAYLVETARVITAFDEGSIAGLIDLIEEAWRAGRRIFLCGNGGSASLATHLACDLGKNCSHPGRPRLKMIALTDNVPTITAYANDLSYAEVFREQLVNLFEPGDLVIGISGSGNSENVVRTLAWAREQGGRTAGILAMGGGRCAPLCDVVVIAPTDDMQHAEDAHAVLAHLIMKVFSRKVAGDDVG